MALQSSISIQTFDRDNVHIKTILIGIVIIYKFYLPSIKGISKINIIFHIKY